MDTRLVIALVIVALILFLIKRSGQVPAQQAANLISQGALIIDVRSPEEFASGSLPGAINLPHGQIGDRITAAASDKNRPILLHCLSGTRSGMAKSQLKALGYTQVHNLGSYARAASILKSVDTP